MTYRISKYTHNAWKAPQKFKNPEGLVIRRFSFPNLLLGVFTFWGCVVTFRYLVRKLVNENILYREWVI